MLKDKQEESITQKIQDSLDELYEKDKQLIEEESHEQAICAQLMCYLKKRFKEFDVDVEYNREGKNRYPKTDDEGRYRKPDIIIHRRGTEDDNLVIILAKGYWNNKENSIKEDKNVLESLRRKHKYKKAFFIEFKKDKAVLKDIEKNHSS